MALKNRINTAKKVLADSRSRVIVLSVAAVALLAIGIGFLKFKKSTSLPAGTHSVISTSVPNIESIPGMGNPTREYAQLQEQQNEQLVQEALVKGKTALPTVVRTTYVDSGISLDTMGQTSVDGCSIEELQRARLAGVKASEMRCRGCSLEALRAAGFTAAELMRAGFSAGELKKVGFSAEELKTAGFSAEDLVSAGFNVAELREAGFSASELAKAGFSASQLLKAGFKVNQLKEAGFSAQELLKAGANAKDLVKAGFSAGELVKAGLELKQLLEAGFSPEALLSAGFEKGDLIRAGIDPQKLLSLSEEKNLKVYERCDVVNLRKARMEGISALKLRRLGCSIEALRNAGFTAQELKKAGFSAGELAKAGFSAVELRGAGFTAQELRKAGFSAKALKEVGFGTEELVAAGYNVAELAKAGFKLKELVNAGVPLSELRKADFSAEALLANGASVESLLKAGFSTGNLLRAGIDANRVIGTDKDSLNLNEDQCSVVKLRELRKKGITRRKLRKLGCEAGVLHAAGFTAEELRNIAFSNEELAKAGFTEEQLKEPDTNQAYDKCHPAALIIARRNKTPVDILAECGLEALKEAGFTAEELARVPLQEQDQVIAELLAEENKSTHQELQKNLRNEIDLLDSSRLDKENQIKTMQAMMMNQSNQLFSAWNPTGSQQYVESIKEDQATGNSAIAGNNTSPTNNQQSEEGEHFKAGTVFFATLDTSINSDENVPVMATIVNGKLKGTKALGTFQRIDKKVVLSFTVLSVPYLTNSIPFSAIAVDPETAKTALASEVDSHYFLRFGTLMGTSFLEGLGEAFKNSGSSIQTTTSGSIMVNPALTVSEKLLVAAGNMASKVASENKHLADTPPTIKVNEGTSLGLLLTADLFVPQKN